MKNPLLKRIPRDLVHNKGRYLAIGIMLTVTIALISGFLAVSDGIEKSFYNNRETNRVEDGQFSSYTEITDAALDKVRKTGAEVEKNFYTEADVKDSANLRIYIKRSNINKETIMEGKTPVAADEIALERLFAETNKISIGDQIALNGKSYRVTGIICLPDYSSLFEKNTDIMMDSFHFGVAVVGKEAFAELSKENIVYNYSYYFNDRNMTEKQKTENSESIKKGLVKNGAALTNFCTAANNQSISFVEDDMGSDVPMMKVFTYILIGIMAFVFVIIINSTIESESAIIGTLLASGYKKNELIVHYISTPLLVSLAGAVIGNAIGYTFMLGVIKDMYYSSYSLPPLKVSLNTEAFLLTTVIPVVMMLLINYFALLRKLSLKPLDFLRRNLKKGRNRRAVKLPEISFINRFRLRVIIQNRSSFLVLFIGIFCASFILMFGIAMTPMIKNYVDSIKTSTVSEYQYLLKAPVKAQEDNGTGDFSGERMSCISLETYYKAAGKNIGASFYGITKDSAYFSASEEFASADGAYFSEGLLKKLGVREGDEITFINPYNYKEYKVRIAGSYDYPAGLAVFMNQEQLNSMLSYDKSYFNGYLSDEELTFADERYVAAIITPEDLAKLGDQMLSTFSSMAQMCLITSVIIYLVLMYVLTKIVIDRNALYISYLKVFGYDRKEVRKVYLTATTTGVVLSLCLSLPLVYLALQISFKLILIKLSGYLPIAIDGYLYAVIVVIGLITYFFINFLHIKRVNAIRMADALKGQE